MSKSSFVITGSVKDAASGRNLQGVLVRAINSNVSVATDTLGRFTLRLTDDLDLLIFTCEGFIRRDISVKGMKEFSVDLYAESFSSFFQEIQDVDGAEDRMGLTHSVGAMFNSGFIPYLSVDEEIQSRLSGNVRSISRSGMPGLGASFFIRGINSLKLNAQPLFVVDGVIWNNLNDVVSLHSGFFTNSLADIAPSEIESVTILKDGTSIYGSKGANGVIIIKTKRGEGVVTNIHLDVTTGLSLKPESLPVMNGDDYRVYASELYSSMGYTNEQFDELLFLNNDPSLVSYRKYHNTTNWDNEVYQIGVLQDYHFSVNGGDERALYDFTVGYSHNKGVVKSTDLQRLNTRFNADFQMTKTFTMQMNLAFTSTDRTLVDDGVNQYTSPTYLAMIKAPFFSPYKYTLSGTLTKEYDKYDDFMIGNPYGVIQQSLNSNKHYRLTVGMKPIIQISPSFTVSSNINYCLDKVKENYYSPFDAVAPNYLDGYGWSYNMSRNQVMRNVSLFSDTRVEYKRAFNTVHQVNAMLGWRYMSENYELDYVEGHNSMSNQKPRVQDAPDFRKVDGIDNRTRSVSNYANLSYSFKNRYLVDLSCAVDGSSRFGSETQGGFEMFDQAWAIFPSVNAAWVISSEKFMNSLSFVDFLKLRAAIGWTGNDAFYPYANSSYFVSEQFYDRTIGLVLGNLGNEEIQWETTSRVSGGVDISVWNDRLNVSADLFSSTTRDLLTLRKLPEVAGNGYYWRNGGEMTNKGFELSAVVKLLNMKSVKWQIAASVGNYVNEVTDLPGGDVITPVLGGEIISTVGQSAGMFYGYKTNGLLRTDEDAALANLKMKNETSAGATSYRYFKAGDMWFDDISGDGIIDERDRQIIGNPNPDFYGSLSSKWSYKRFNLEALCTFSYGNEIYNYQRSQLESGATLNNQTTAMLNRWRVNGQSTSMPRPHFGDPMGNSRFSDRWIEDGSYLKIKSITLSYEIPYQGNMIKGITAWMSANNVFTFTRYLGRDPEVSPFNDVLMQGVDMGLLPQTTSFFLGVKLNL